MGWWESSGFMISEITGDTKMASGVAPIWSQISGSMGQLSSFPCLVARKVGMRAMPGDLETCLDQAERNGLGV